MKSMNLSKLLQIGAVTWLALLGSAAIAQQALGPRSGTVEAINQEEGYIIISAERIPYDEGGVSVVYQGRSVRTTFLTPGLIVNYQLNENGTIGQIVLIGPPRILELIDQH